MNIGSLCLDDLCYMYQILGIEYWSYKLEFELRVQIIGMDVKFKLEGRGRLYYY